MEFSVIIVSYNSQRYIKECLESVCAQDFGDYEAFVVDNASTDKTVQIVKEFGGRVRIEANETNKGFPAALNQGIRLSRGRYILTLNPDTVLKKDFLSVLKKEMAAFKDNVGMAGVKLLRKEQKERIIDSTGLVLSKFVRFFDRGAGKRDLGQYDDQKDILGPCAAAAMYKREMLDDIKCENQFFDEDFFYLLEDFDLALRARKKGWVCRYVPQAVCYHIRNGCRTTRSHRQYLSFRNRHFLIIKNMKITPFLIFSFFVYDIPRSIFMLVVNRRTWDALKEIKRYWPRMLKKRVQINSALSGS